LSVVIIGANVKTALRSNQRVMTRMHYECSCRFRVEWTSEKTGHAGNRDVSIDSKLGRKCHSRQTNVVAGDYGVRTEGSSIVIVRFYTNILPK